MVNIPMKSTGPLNKSTVQSLNSIRVESAISSQTIQTLNRRGTNNTNSNSYNPSAVPASNPAPTHTPAPPPQHIADKTIPDLLKPVQKGQKIPLENDSKLSAVRAAIGWNVINPACDVDVSAFLLNAQGKVIGDEWFVFYGQTTSPDGSTIFSEDNGADREYIHVNLNSINPEVKKIVFVLTINEAFEKQLNFSMIKDAYIRIINETNNTELVSFKMDEYYSNVTSMMIGEIYLHNGLWKFNAVGNGVARDLAGLCELYGVQVE